MQKQSSYIINGITVYRIIAAPVLIYLVIIKDIDLFKWLLAISFFTDSIDGFLARKYKVTSIMGSRLDSIGDDLTIAAAFAGMIFIKTQFIKDEIIIFSILFLLYVLQNILALVKYHKTTSFHTYFAKIAAVFQGLFMILIFFLTKPFMPLFYVAIILTAIDLIEETIMILLLPNWETDIKGIYWIMKRKREK
jgi:phosphatidylglycerophosphate synthase